MIYDSFYYRDPMLVAMRNDERRQKEKSQCGDCVNKRTIVINGKELHRCDLNKIYGRRCWQYKGIFKSPVKHL